MSGDERERWRKILWIINYSRLVHFLSEDNVLSKRQIGFVPNDRTTDHVFTQHTLINKQTIQNKGKVFSCFVDFKKALDSIWHEGLLYKLMESGIGGKIYDIIKSTYTNNKKAKVTELNDYRPVALTSIIMKCFESRNISPPPYLTP